jgi:hypothetical protein
VTDSDDPKKNCYLTLHMGLGAGLITAIHVGGLYGRCARPSLASLRLAALPSGRATARLARTVAWRGEAWRGVAWRGEARRGEAWRGDQGRRLCAWSVATADGAAAGTVATRCKLIGR